MKKFNLIVFDWDGTLFDSTGLIARCIQSACQDVGQPLPSDADARYVIGLGLSEALQHVAPGLPVAEHAQLRDRYRFHYVSRQNEIVLFEGVLPMLQALKARGHALAVATGKSRPGLDEALQSTELHQLFDASRTADETVSKPHPQMLMELMSELAMAPDQVLMIGDTTHDLQLALNARVSSVAVSYGAHESEAFSSFPVCHVARSVADLHDWLRRYA
jgi:phosphoglycolate phosphatase